MTFHWETINDKVEHCVKRYYEGCEEQATHYKVHHFYFFADVRVPRLDERKPYCQRHYLLERLDEKNKDYMRKKELEGLP